MGMRVRWGLAVAFAMTVLVSAQANKTVWDGVNSDAQAGRG